MVNVLVKVLVGAAAVAVAGVVVAKVTSSKKEQESMEEAAEEKVGLIQRIKKAATKKVVKFLAWVALHSEQIEAASTVIGLGTGVFGIISAAKEFKRGNDTEKKLDEMNKKLDSFLETYDHNVEVHGQNLESFRRVLDAVCEIDEKEAA